MQVHLIRFSPYPSCFQSSRKIPSFSPIQNNLANDAIAQAL